MIKKILYIALFFFLLPGVQAQDFQLSQYYNTPLYMNPAFAGTPNDSRIAVNYRAQWLGLGDPFTGITFSADHHLIPAKSGVGLIVRNDAQGSARLNSTEVGLLYSYPIKLNDHWSFRPGLQLGFGIRSLNYSKALFGDQFNSNGPTGTGSNDPLASGQNKFYPDLGSGLLLYNNHLWVGMSGHHLNFPNLALGSGVKSRLPLKFSIHSGYKIYLNKPSGYTARHSHHIDWTLTPTFMYKSQGQYDQLDLGVYTEYFPMMAGLWYRGLPIKNYQPGFGNSESIIAMVGFTFHQLAFCYSYDIPVSKLTGYSGGAHELTLSYVWEVYPQSMKTNEDGELPCPNLNRRFKKTMYIDP